MPKQNICTLINFNHIGNFRNSTEQISAFQYKGDLNHGHKSNCFHKLLKSYAVAQKDLTFHNKWKKKIIIHYCYFIINEENEIVFLPHTPYN